MTESMALVIWLILLALAFPYVRRVKHPQTPTLAAFLLFVMLFSMVSGVLFFTLSWMLVRAGWASALTQPAWILAYLAAVFIPGFLFARWMIRRPPWNRPIPK